MEAYTPTGNTFISPVFIIEKQDLIEDGVDGNDSKGNVQNGESLAYLKRYNCDIYRGSGAPSGTYGIIMDEHSPAVTFYFDEVTESFWQPQVSGKTFLGWINITSQFVLNINGAQFNKNGDETKYIGAYYDIANPSNPSMIIYDRFNDLANLRVRKIIYDQAQGITANMLMVIDDEVILNSSTTQQSENKDAGVAVKWIEPSDQTVNSKHFHYLPAYDYFRAYDDKGNWLGLNASRLYMNDASFEGVGDEESFISKQSEFDAVFNTAGYGGTTVIPSSITTNAVYIKGGTYTLTNFVEIQKPSFRMRLAPDCKILVSLPYTGSPLFTFSADSIEFDGWLDMNNYLYTPIFYIHSSTGCKVVVKGSNMNAGTIFESDGTGINTNLILTEISGDIVSAPTGSLGVVFKGLTGAMLGGSFEVLYGDAFTNCQNYIFRGHLNGYSHRQNG